MTITSHHVESTGTFVQTVTSGSFTPTASSRLYVFAAAIGFDEPYDWVITDSDGLTWNELYAPADLEDLGDTSFDGTIRMWYADVGGSPSSMTVTIDCYDASTTTAAYGWTVIEDSLAQTIANSDFLAYAATSNSDTAINSIALDLSATPSGEQLFIYCRGTNNAGTDTYDSNPTDFDDLAEDLTGYITVGTLTSPDNTDGTVAWGSSGPGQSRLSGGAHIEFAGADTDAPAEAATGTGTASAPTAALGVSAGQAAATGAAADPTGALGAAAEAATAAGSAGDATVAVTVNAEAATATGTASDAMPAAGGDGEAATATGTAYDASAAVTATAEAATGTGTAPQPSTAVTVNAEAATGTGTASDATVSTDAATNAPAETATGTGSAGDPTPAVAPASEAATATGTASDASTDVTVTAETATATGTSYDAATGAAVTAEAATATGTAADVTGGLSPAAETATASGAAYDPAPAVTATAETATGTGAASDPTPAAGAAAGSASATGTASDATVTLSGQASAETASATGTAYQATAALGAPASAATGRAEAADASIVTVAGDATVAKSGWFGMVQINRRRIEQFAQSDEPPVACPIDGHRLEEDADGELVCPFDGWRPSFKPSGWHGLAEDPVDAASPGGWGEVAQFIRD